MGTEQGAFVLFERTRKCYVIIIDWKIHFGCVRFLFSRLF